MASSPDKTSTIEAVGMVRSIPLEFFGGLKRTSFVVLTLGLMVLGFYGLAGLLGEDLIETVFSSRLPAIDRDLVLGVVSISLSLWAISVLVLAFVHQKLMRLGKGLGKGVAEGANLAEYLDFRAASLLAKAKKMGHLPLDKLLLYYILRSGDLGFALQRLSVSRDDLKAKLLDGMKARSQNYSRDDVARLNEENRLALERILLSASKISVSNGQDRITVFDIFLVLADTDDNFQQAMDDLELLKEDIDSVVLWQSRLETYRKFRARFWERDNLRILFSTSPVQELIGGFTVTLDLYAHDITVNNPLRQGGVVLHAREIEQLEEALMKERGGGIMLAGPAGSGRKSIVYNFANRVASETSARTLNFLRILEIDMVALIAAFPDKSVLAGTLKQIFTEAVKAKNVVLVLPQIHNYIGPREGGAAEVDISAVVNEFLLRPGFRLIGIATTEGLHKFVERVPEVSGKFRVIHIAKVGPDDAMKVLKEEGLRREKKSRVFIPITTLKEIVKLCDYFLAEEFPTKAVNFLDDVIANVDVESGKHRRPILPEEVDALFSRKYDVPAGAAGKKEKEILLNLEDRIHEGLINQKEAVAELANALRRCRAEVKKRKRTIGNFLFLGPTGCGKTEAAKQLARAYFGSEKSMIRLDMSEYQNVDAIDKLIGSDRAPGYLTSAVKEMPFSLILIDEIEKAHSGLLNIFLSVFDEGQMTDGAGRSVDFRHNIIIATSNAGAEYIKEAIDRGSGLANLRDSFVDNILRRGLFKPEFINRFDSLVLFRPLDAEEMCQVAGLMLGEIKEGLRQKRIDFAVTLELTQKISQMGFDPAFGGRAMRRIIQDKIENALAKAILSGRIKSGDACEFNLETWELLVGDERRQYHENRVAAGQAEEIDAMADTYLRLEDRIHEGLINQKEAVAELANALRRAHANLKKAKRTVGNFLFLGPTGCGKTETAKQLARVFYGSPKNMIRLNMAEFQSAESIDKLIGNLESPGMLTTQITERPESLILIDEIEKANPKILNLFLSVFDDGQLFDGAGRPVDFKKAIIIATSNAGADLIKEAIGKNIPMDGEFKKNFIDFLLQRGIFTPEFINRFDAAVLYRPLGNDEMKQVAGLMLKDIQAGLADKGIEFRVSDSLAAKLVQIGFNPVFGGRSMRRTVQDKVENAIVRALLSRQIKKGDIVEIDPDIWEAVVVNAL